MEVTEGKEYVVYAVLIDPRASWLEWFYIIDDLDLGFPTWYPSCVFEVTDSSLPKIWFYGSLWISEPKLEGQPRQILLANREWVEDPLFYERLTDGEAEEVRVFESVRRELGG
jgi:hypothetical protein